MIFIIKKHYDFIIIGGGAAGCLAACTAAEKNPDLKILIIEKNRALMRKLGITGKGRCNLTNNTDVENCIKNFPTNGKFMYSALNAFSPADVMRYFENLGVRLKTERGNRVFPQSDKASDIVNALKNRIHELGIKTVCDRAEKVLTENNAVIGIKCENNDYYSENILLSTGGLSYSKTGSDGDGYRMAERLGHTIISPKPSLVPIITEEDCSALSGLSLKNVKVSLTDKKSGKVLFSEQGEMLFTHFGMSGPLILSASSYIKENHGYNIIIDLKPALNTETLNARLLRDFSEQKNKYFQNALIKLMPEKLTAPFAMRTGIPPEKPVNEITREERQVIIKKLKAFDFTFASLRPIEEAVITDGGISVKEIFPSDMSSRLIRGLYFAGEIIDVAGFTGGFNLQAAFSSANAVSSALTQNLTQKQE